MSDNKTMSDNNETKPQKGEWAKREKGAFWKRTSRDGSQTYLSGHVVTTDEFGMEQRLKVVMFTNKDKDPKSERYNEKAPDYKMYLSKDPAEESQSTNAEAQPDSKVEADENEEVL